MTAAGFPHSGISGSTPTCGSPTLIAAYRALLRLSVPRHPPCALLSLDRIMLAWPWLAAKALRSTEPITHALVLLLEPEALTLPTPFLLPNPLPVFSIRPARGFKSPRSLLM